MSYHAHWLGAHDTDPWYEDDTTYLDMEFWGKGVELKILQFIQAENTNCNLIRYSIGFEDGTDEGYVYLMEAVGSPRFKIGLSCQPKRRQKQLNRGQSPYPIERVHTSKVSNMGRSEEFLKRAFAPWREHGEWFELTPDHIELIKLVRFF